MPALVKRSLMPCILALLFFLGQAQMHAAQNKFVDLYKLQTVRTGNVDFIAGYNHAASTSSAKAPGSAEEIAT